MVIVATSPPRRMNWPREIFWKAEGYLAVMYSSKR